MVKGLKVGLKVRGQCSKVLAKGDYDKAIRNDTIFGVITAQVGIGKKRTWRVKWKHPLKTSEVGPRRLELAADDDDDSIESSSNGDDSSQSEESETPEVEEISPPEGSESLNPHGLKWSHAGEISEDSWTGTNRNFDLKWPMT